MKTDTPRTDAVEFQAHPGLMPPYNTVPSTFARTLERELNASRWIPITERLPTIEDANYFQDVEWSDGKDIWQGNYKDDDTATHWRSITLP